MPQSAIHPDVQKTQAELDAEAATAAAQSEANRKLSAREEAMASIYKNRLDSFEEESGIKLARTAPDADPDADPDDAEAAAARAKLEAGEQLETQLDEPTKPAKPAKADPEPDLLQRKVKVKIDGVEDEVSIEEMQREYQKGRTADKRLAEAARLQREIEAQRAAEAQRATEAAAAKREPPKVEIDPAITKKFTSAMFSGDEETAVSAFQAAVADAVSKVELGREPATPVNVDEITATIEQRLTVKSALDKSRSEYPELYADPDIEALGAIKIQNKRAQGMSFAEALEEVGSEFAEKFGWKKPATPEPKPSSTTREAKLAAKKALDPVEGINVKSTTTEAVPMTNSQVIADMARRRPGYA